ALAPPARGGRLGVDDGYDLIGLALFPAVAVSIVVLTEALHGTRRRAELLRDAPSQAEARLRGVIASATDAIITIDADQKITLFNAAAEATFGYPARELIRETLDRLIPARLRTGRPGHADAFGSPG